MGAESPGDTPDAMDTSVTQERSRKRNAEPINQNTTTKRVITSSENLDRTYGPNDLGPFIVHITRIEPDPAAGLSLRPIKIGLLLTKNNIENIVRDGVKSVGRNRVSIEFKRGEDANTFLQHKCLNGCKLKASIPAFNVTRMSLVRGVPKEWSMVELVESLELPENCGKVLKARRLNRKIINEGTPSWVPTQSVVLTFSRQVLPKHIYAYYTSMVVEKYLLPTIQCHSCCRFGHVKLQCRSKPRCFKCGQEHFGESCQLTGNALSCILCTGKHQATYKDCPEHQCQRNININGFRRGLSVESNLSNFTSDLITEVDKGQQIDAIYTDFSSAFDKVDHQILIQKLSQYGFGNPLIMWFKSYLDQRPQTVVVNGYESETYNARSGVPQGSHLGPLLFLAFINDVTMEIKHCKYSLFADDLKIYKTINSDADIRLIQDDLDRVTT
ncbi:uncharacterized protein LOC128199516 [Bicyclus anynana]|uniref:Uncharacterized protein LOC128199516 n=1 Tax=Bicyclus anynana TaxID=110368 RepID=A0ABM3M225_BICAN|nr:uncharacterized protein LOC128199516 [Bicyclus anynana]XP_052745439.1 uncharacterized protein LOC128199516 [Bicyclus anynana]